MPVIEDFTGLNNVDAPERLAESDLREAVNVDIDDQRRIRSRKGYTQVYSGTDVHSFWSNQSLNLFVEEGSLKQLNSDYTASVLRTGLHRFHKAAYADVNGDAYYTNGDVTGIVKSDGSTTSLGIPTPVKRASLVSATGILPAGTYGVSFTLVDDAGQESGPSLPSYIELTDVGAITVTGTPDESFNLYCTTADGDTFYLYGGFSAGTSSVKITSVPARRVLRTEYMEQMPAGHLIAEHAGRLYIAVDNVLYYSEPWMYGLTRLTRNFIQFPERITMVASTDDGMFISSDRTYFVFGRNPDEFSVLDKASYAALEGTATEVEPSAAGEGVAAQRVWMWLTPKGVCTGTTGGGFQNVTEKKYAVQNGINGVGMFRQKEGMSQYISILERNDDDVDNLYTTDIAVAEVRRNGVIIT